LFLIGWHEDAHRRAAIVFVERLKIGIIGVVGMTLELAYSGQLVDDVSIKQAEQSNAEDNDEYYLQH
jgi:hypothetical protein